jgi:hypothetical protein
MAGLAGRRAHRLPGSPIGAWRNGRALAVEEHHPGDPGLLPEALHHLRDQAAVVLHHLVLERRAHDLALRESGRPLAGDQRPEMVDGVDVRPDGASDGHRGSDARGEAGRHADQAPSHGAGRGKPRAIVADAPGGVNA